MNRIFFLLSLPFLFTTHMALSQNLEIPGPYHWKNLILLVFPPDGNSGQKEQAAIFEEHQEGPEERDLVVFNIKSTAVSTPEGRTAGEVAAKKLRNHFNVW